MTCVSPQDMTDRQRFIDAETLLFQTVETTDPATGARILNWIETPLYREYRARLAAYEAAQKAYAAAHKAAQRNARGWSSWPLRGTTHHLSVKLAHERWRSDGAEKIEAAEALIEQFSSAEAV
jgi:hypothetical protein